MSAISPLRKDLKHIKKQIKIQYQDLDKLIKNINKVSPDGLYKAVEMYANNFNIISGNFEKIKQTRFKKREEENVANKKTDDNGTDSKSSISTDSSK